jgi:hypothetical protein
MNQTSIQEEIKSRPKTENACYHSVHLLSSSLQLRSTNIKIYRNVILPVVLYGCGTWSLTLRKQCRTKAFDNRVLWRIFGPKRNEETGEWKKLHNEKLNDLYSSPNIIWVIKNNEMGGAGSPYGGGVYTGFSRGNLRERNHLEDPGIDGTIILRWIIRTCNGGHVLD